MMEEVACCHCGRYFIPDPRQKHPRYCGKQECQHARKAAWQRETIRGDPDYQANQKRCRQEWCKEHPDYWKAYRRNHPEQANRNRELQRMRNRRCRSGERGNLSGEKEPLIAKMDALEGVGILGKTTFYGQFWLVPVVAKMDALKVNIYVISTI